MVDDVVLDASAGLAIVRSEPAGPALIEQLRAMPHGARIVVPQVFWLEIGNVLIRRYRLSVEEVVRALPILDKLRLRSVDLDRPTWLLSLDRAARFGLAAYDAVYLALADSLDARLLTLDRALATAAGPRAMLIGPARLAESPVPYDVPSPLVVWAKFGAYLSELRRDAMERSDVQSARR